MFPNMRKNTLIVQWVLVYFVSCRLYPSFPSHHGRVWLLSVISLPLTYTVSLVRVTPYSVYMIGEVSWKSKEDEFGPLSTVYYYFMVFSPPGALVFSFSVVECDIETTFYGISRMRELPGHHLPGR